MNSTPHIDRNRKFSNGLLFSMYYIFIFGDKNYRRNNLQDTAKQVVLHSVLKDDLTDSSLSFAT